MDVQFQMHQRTNPPNNTGKYITGLIFVFVGAGLLLDNFGLVDFWPLLGTWWPAAIMVLALVKIITRSGSLLGSSFVFAVGAILQLGQLDMIDGFWSVFWPIVLILIGLSIILGKKKLETVAANNIGEGMPLDSDFLSQNAIFGGASARVTSQKFKGGDITAAFGGLEIDLRGAEIEGQQATLKATAAFGGIELRVPPHWSVVIRGTPILGGIEDKTIRYRDANVLGPTLVLDATVILGGIEIS